MWGVNSGGISSSSKEEAVGWGVRGVKSGGVSSSSDVSICFLSFALSFPFVVSSYI